MHFLLLGAGLQGRAIAHDLLVHGADDDKLTVLDRDQAALDGLARFLDDARLETVAGDVAEEGVVGPLLADADVCVSAVNYWFNAELTRLAIAHRCHFLDLGGNNDVVERQLAQDADARAAGVTVVPDCGLAPGLAGLLGYDLAEQFDRCEHLRLRVGGLPAEPRPPWNYMLVFSVHGLINEYVEPCMVIRDGEVRTVPGLSELERLDFPGFGRLEAFQTSGGTSTLPRTLRGRVGNLDYKTIRYPGHCEMVRALAAAGLADTEPVAVRDEHGEVRVRPRDVLAACWERVLPREGADVVLLLVEADGEVDGRRVRRSLRMVDHADPETGLSAMMRMTGFPAAIVARMLANGTIAEPGARPQELVVPAAGMLDALAHRGILAVIEQHDLRR